MTKQNELNIAKITPLAIKLWIETNTFLQDFDAQCNECECEYLSLGWSYRELVDDHARMQRASFRVIEGGKK